MQRAGGRPCGSCSVARGAGVDRTSGLDELGWPAFERLVASQDQRAIFVFVNYLFSKHNLENWMKPEWLKIYDEEYVDSDLIGGLLKWAEPAGQMLATMEENARALSTAPGRAGRPGS